KSCPPHAPSDQAGMTPLILKRGSLSRRREDDFDVLENGGVVGRIFCLDAVAGAAPGRGRAATSATSDPRRMAMSPGARTQWRRSRRAGGASDARTTPFLCED